MPNPKDFHLLFPESEASKDGGVRARHEDGWLEGQMDGRLSVDVIEGDKDITVRAPIAGVKAENLEVFVHDAMLTIRGKRHGDVVSEENANYLVRECHWGSFSRSIILPVEVDANAIAASLKDGVLTVTLPKASHAKRTPAHKR